MRASHVGRLIAIAFATVGAGVAAEADTKTIRIETIETGNGHIGKNPFRAVVANKTNGPVTLVVDLRAVPGLWFRPNMQRQFAFVVWPGDPQKLEAEYEFTHLSSESVLRVRFYFPRVSDDGVTSLGEPFFDRRYNVVGNGNDSAREDKPFEHRETRHHSIYYVRGSTAAADIDRIAAERDAGFEKVSSILGVSREAKIRLVLFPDEDWKIRHTGHHGAGMADGDQIAEVYNEKIKLDPYHETAHILAEPLGGQAALFNEGLAVYVSEMLGADALGELGAPGKSCNQAVALHLKAGAFVELRTLLSFDEIGSDRTRPLISYPEACSVVGYLIRNYGFEKLREAFAKIKPGGEATFAEIYGVSLSEIERQWKGQLTTH